MGFFCSEKLSQIRKQRGFKTIEGLAIALREIIPTVSKMTIHHWERSGRTPSYRYLMALCQVLNIEPHELSKTKQGKQNAKRQVDDG